MTLRGTALLLAVLAALGGYLWLVDGPPRGTSGGPGASSDVPPLLARPPAEVVRVDLAEGERRLTAIRRDDGWRDPGGRLWGHDVVSDLLAALGSLRPLTIVARDPLAPADYGLGPAAPRLMLLDADGRRILALELGERNPASTGLYVRRVGEQEVMLVGAVLGWEVDKLRAAARGP